MDRVWEVARELAAGPPLVFASIKEVAREAESMKFQEAMNWITKRQFETRLQGVCRETRPGVEG